MTVRNSDYLHGFLVCALWASGEEFDEFAIIDFTESALERAENYVDKFLAVNADDIKKALEFIDAENIGHCLWLSSNGHGAGFFDYCGDYFERLQEAARYHEMNLYVTDSGQVDIM